MSILSLPASLHRPARSRLTGLAAFWTDAIHEIRARKAAHAMQGLSDDMLHDIGVSRGEIEQVTRHGRPPRL